MASESVIDAVVSKWASSITTSGFPAEMWFDGVPIRRADGTTINLPTIELQDGGTTVDYELEETPIETTTLTIIVRAVTLPAADAIVKQVKYGGGAVSAGLGFDFTLSLPFSSGIRLFRGGMIRQSEHRSVEPPAGPGASLVHRVDLVYTVTTIRTGV